MGGGVLQYVEVYCSVLQCVAVRCGVLQRVVVCCSVLQCVAAGCSVLQCVLKREYLLAVQIPVTRGAAMCFVCCSVLQCVAAYSEMHMPLSDADSGLSWCGRRTLSTKLFATRTVTQISPPIWFVWSPPRYLYVQLLIHTCDVTLSYPWHDSLSTQWYATQTVTHPTYGLSGSPKVFVRAMTHSYV